MKEVQIPPSHRHEWKSQRAFEDVISPWTLVGAWNPKDYGIDGVFSINDNIQNSESATPTGLNFLVQLKSSTVLKIAKGIISFPVEVRKIHQWHQNNLPVLLAIYDVKNNEFFYLWIGGDLINQLNKDKADWINKKTISISIPTSNCFKGDFKRSLKTYVKTIYPAQINKSRPGVYFDLKIQTKALTSRFQLLANRFTFDSPILKANNLQKELELAIYRVAIAGPSRVGKSSLINALVGRKNVSPTGIYQTTGVPIQIIAGKEELVEVYFQNNRVETYKYSADKVKEFAAQDKDCNPKNKKNVALISIHLLNPQLDKGVCYYDLPGLDDPNDVIAGYSRDTLKNANAVVYVIDGSNAATGGYCFRSEYKRDLENFAKENQKLFLVFNKVNFLKPSIKQGLKARVIEDLIEHKLYDKVNERVYFVSAEDGLKYRLKGKSDVSFGEFDEDLWRFILSNNKYGIYKLNEVLKNLNSAVNDFDGILNTRQMKGSKSAELSNALNEIQTKVPSLQKIFDGQMRSISSNVQGKLKLVTQEGLIKLRAELTQWPRHVDLPNTAFIKDRMSKNAVLAIEATNIELQQGANQLQQILDNWIGDNMKSVRKIADSDEDRQAIDFSDIGNIKSPDIDISQSLGIGLASSLIMFLLNPSFAVATFFLAAFGSWFLSAESRRAEQINNIMKQANYNSSKFLEACNDQYEVAIDAYSQKMAEYVNTQLKAHLNDLKRQIEDLGKPLSNKEQVAYQDAFEEFKKFRSEIEELKDEVQVYYHQS